MSPENTPAIRDDEGLREMVPLPFLLVHCQTAFSHNRDISIKLTQVSLWADMQVQFTYVFLTMEGMFIFNNFILLFFLREEEMINGRQGI